MSADEATAQGVDDTFEPEMEREPMDPTLEALQGLAEHAAGVVEMAARAHPAATVAVGAGAGYILAAGLPSWLVRAGAAMAARTVAREVVQVAVATVADAARSAARPTEG